jgi:hypothetical protein
MRPFNFCLPLLLAATAAAAQTPAAPPMPYTSVKEALAQLEARDGNGTVVTRADGWVTVAEPLASAQWSFTPAGHEAHPAVVRRTILRGPGREVAVDTQSICEAPAAACAKLLAEFEALNDRIVQAVKSRGRGPMPAPGSRP